jgi:hypothetical protein
MSRLSFFALASWLLAGSALAHHSTAEYDRSALRELEGELVAVGWHNPHVTFRLRAINGAGGVEDWELSGLPIALLAKAGLAENMFAVGARVKAAGYPSRRRAAMLVNNLLLPNGEEALFYPESRLRWSDKAAGGQWVRESVASDRRGLYRIWSVADLAAYLKAARAVAFQLTPEAQAKMAAAPPPALDVCKPQGMPGFMLAPLPMGFVDRGDRIDLQHTSFGVTRTIHMTSALDPNEVAPSDLGYSRGRWVGDTLEVRTTRIGWPYVDDDGRPQSANVEVLEQFSLLDGGSVLRYTQTVADPGSLVQPMTVTWDLIDAGDTAIEPIVCERG